MSERHLTMAERITGAQARLHRAAIAFAKSPQLPHPELYMAANEYSFACWLSHQARPASKSPVVTFGKKTQGKRVDELPSPDLEDLRTYLTKAVSDPAKARFKVDNAALLKAITDELALRSGS